jgi:beta-phosphoglucomutase
LSWDALLFDFDGVLADTEPIHFSCWRDILQPYGIQLDWGFYQKQCVGLSDRYMIRTLAAERNPPIAFEELWSECDRKQILFRERIEANPPFLEETIDVVKQLSSAYKLAVVSSSGRYEVETPIERAGFRHCFQTLVCGREVQNLKPAPDPYLKAAEILGATKPLVIEDSDAGLASGRAAGFDVLRITDPRSVASQLRATLGVR